MRGPRRILDLDGVPRERWRVDERSAVVWRGRLWNVEAHGCVLCVDTDNPTLCNVGAEDVEAFHCMEHGELVAVPFSMKKVYTVAIGDVVREGEESVNDSMLFPAAMTLVERNDLVRRLLDEAQQEEVSRGTT